MKREEIKRIFEKNIGLKVQSIRKLGMGVCNVNYLITSQNNKFVFKTNANPQKTEKYKEEFNSLKAIEDLNISPKPLSFGKDFMILTYVEGTPFTGKKVTPKFLISLAELVAEIHSLKTPKNIDRGRNDLSDSSVKEYLEYLKRNLKNKVLLGIISNAKKKMEEKQKILRQFKRVEVIAHGDICEQNILETPKGLALIDFEDLSVKDSASDIAKIFVDFKVPFNKTQKDIFLKEYFNRRKDKTLRERIKFYELFVIFETLLWAIYHVLKIKNKELHKSFLNKKKLKEGIDYVGEMWSRAINFGIIDKKYSKFDMKKTLK